MVLKNQKSILFISLVLTLILGENLADVIDFTTSEPDYTDILTDIDYSETTQVEQTTNSDYLYDLNTKNASNSSSDFLLFTGNNQTRPSLGINVGTITTGMSQWVFTNKFKHAGVWRPVSTGNNWQNYSFYGAIPTQWSSDLWPLNFTSRNRLGWMTQLGTDGVYPTGRYVIKWEGTGNISLLGDARDIIIVDNNKLEFNVNVTTTQGLIIIVTAPNVTNIDLREKFEENSTSTFGTLFLNALRPFRALRFASWMVNTIDARSVSNVSNTEWETRRPPTFYTQAGKQMVSIEYIIELANVLSKDIWLSIPSGVSDNHILKMAQYVKQNFINSSAIIYLEQSSDKMFSGNNRTAELNLVNIWKTVRDRRVRNVMAISFYEFYNNPRVYSAADYALFDYYSVSGAIGHLNPFTGYTKAYNVSLSANFTKQDILDVIRQEIYRDEIDLIRLRQLVAHDFKKPLLGYDVGFRFTAPTYLNRFQKTPLADLEQRLEDLLIEAQKDPLMTDLYLDFMERWYRLGGDVMFLSNLVDYVDRCTPSVNHYCGYHSTLVSLTTNPEENPKYKAALYWLNGTKGSLPFTSDDVPKQAPVPCALPCVWGTCYQGKCICYDGFNGTSCNQSVPKYLDCNSNQIFFGMNMDGVPDWSTEVTFTNVHYRSRKWIVERIVYGTKWADWDQNDIELDENGYPRYLKIGQTVGTFQVRDVQAHFPAGKYICLYDGDGVLDFTFDITVTKRSAGRIELFANWTTWLNNGMYYRIIRTNPSDPVRNVRIFEAKFEDTYEYFPYHPLFLELMKKYSVIRFMGWSNPNIEGAVDWSNRTTNSYYSFNQLTGVSIEMQVKLCNLLGSNPWFNLPYRATDEYIINWATYVRDNLRPDVTIYIEQANECWASNNPCGSYAQNMGLLENITIIARNNYYSRELQARTCYHAKVGKHYATLIKNVFNNGGNSSRLKFVLGTQAAWLGPIETFFLCPDNISLAYDVIALAPYLGDNMTNADGTLISLDDLYNTRIAPAIQESLRLLQMIANATKVSSKPIDIALYESGPDFSTLTDTSNVEKTNLSFYIHRDPRIFSALTSYFSNLTQISSLKVINYFSSGGKCSKYGCWGITESSDSNLETSYKYKAYNDFIASKGKCAFKEKTHTCPTSNCGSIGVCAANNSLSINADTCYCYFGYSPLPNNTCQIDYIISTKCTYQCGGHGTCSFDHYDGFYAVYTCHCDQGYYGYGCGLFNCTNECNYNGVCVDSNNCTCYRGYKGLFCEIDCGCDGRGSCASNSSQCICDNGYIFIDGKCRLNCAVTDARPECSICPADCVNGDCLVGVCQCWAGYKLDTRGTCTLRTTSPNDGSKMGINLNGVVDWSSQWAFVDLIKQARNWIVQHIDNLDDLYIWSVNEPFKPNLRSDNYPATIPYQRQYVTLMLRDVRQHWPNSTYYVYYDGEGLLDFGFDAKIIDQTEKYRLKISVNLTIQLNNGVFMKIKKTNPANPLRNIRIVQNGFQDTYLANPFHPLFVDKLRQFKTIRFMDWTGQDDAFGNPITSWNMRVNQSTYSQGVGVAYEEMIRLCNMLKTNCWLTVPYAADDDFVTQMANLVLKSLRTDVKVYVEYSNEAWNTLFNSGKYCISMGFKLGLSTDPVVARNNYYSLRSKQIITIWKNVYASQSDRIVLVLGSFVVMPSITQRILSYNDVYRSHTNVMLAITGYFGCGDISASTLAVSDISIIFNGCDADVIVMQQLLQKHADIARNFSVKIGMYESGAGLVEYSAIESGHTTPGATEKYIAASTDPRMYGVYKQYYAMFERLNLTENCHYAYVGMPSMYGSWMLLEYQDQSLANAHRYRAMLEIINQTRLAVSTINYTCSNILYSNSLSVCSGKGICVSQDQCDMFATPASQSPILIYPTSGTAINTTFYIQTRPWLSKLPLKYAFGFNLTNYGNIVLTEYSKLPYAITFLPFINGPLNVVLFAKDSLGNVYTNRSNMQVSVSPYSGNLASLQQIITRFTASQKLVVQYDKSPATLDWMAQQANNINLTGNDTQAALSNLQALTTSNTNSSAIGSITQKLDSFLTSISSSLQAGNTANMLSTDDTQSCINIISNIYSSGSTNSSETLLESITNMLLLNGSQTANNTEQNRLPSVSFTSTSLAITVSSFNLSTYKSSGSYVRQEDLSLNLSEIFSSIPNTNLGGVSVIKYPIQTSNTNGVTFASSQIDVKFFSGTTKLTNVRGLRSPIILQFTIDNSIDLSKNYLKLQCQYYDTASSVWSTSGCEAASFNLTSRVMTCNCNHATKFSILQGSTCTSINLNDCLGSFAEVQIKISLLISFILIVISILNSFYNF